MADFAPGAYSVTYDPPPGGSPVTLGQTEGPKRFQMTPLGEPVRIDAFGRRVVDVVDQGQDWFVQMILKEWNAAIEAALFPYGSTYGLPDDNVDLEVLVAGRLYSTMAGILVLTSQAGTPARTQGPGGAGGIITIPLAIIVVDQQIEAVLGNVERNTPVTFQCLPSVSGVTFVET